MFNYKVWVGFKDHEADFSVLRDSEDSLRLHTLFVERKEQGEVPLYTLKDFEFKGYPSAYLVYMSSVDEYDAAMRLVGSMSHWRSLLKLDWFMRGIITQDFSGVTQWREDMKLRDLSEAKETMHSAMKVEKVDNDGNPYTAINHSAAKNLGDMAKNPVYAGDVKIVSRRVRDASKVDAKVNSNSSKILELHNKLRKA